MAEPQRIAKLMARAGVASRREIERMIEDRRIAIDGLAIETPATIVRSLAGVTVDGKPVAEPDHARLFLYHKPTGVLTAATDPAGRKTIYDRMPPGLPRVVPVGRLDLNTEGLLLLTTDGGLKRQLELPATGVERTYRARCYGAVTQDQLESLSEGVEIEGIRYGSIDANLERRTGANQWIQLRLREGKNREVRRVLEFLGLEVNRLIRVSYGPFVLADLPVADVVEVLQNDLVSFLRDLKNDPVARAATQAAAARAVTGSGEARPATARFVRAVGAPRATPVADRMTGRRPGATAAAGKPVTPRTTSQNEKVATRISRANPHKARDGNPASRQADTRPPPPAQPAEGERPQKQVKGKGWAKASRPTKKVGVATGKRPAPRGDRPMTDERPDFTAGATPRPARAQESKARHWRAPPASDGAPPGAPVRPSRQGPAPGGASKGRPARPDKRR